MAASTYHFVQPSRDSCYRIDSGVYQPDFSGNITIAAYLPFTFTPPVAEPVYPEAWRFSHA